MYAWNLPTSLNVGGKDYKIRTDYRVILDILSAMNDPDIFEPGMSQEEMKQDIVVRDALGLPGLVQGILGNPFAVHIDIDLFPFGTVVRLHVSGHPALNPPALIVVGAAAFIIVISPNLKAVNIKLPHIVPDAVKIFNQLLKFRHFPTLFCQFPVF